MNLSFADAAKAKQLREFFSKHGRIYIVVDASSDDVDVPEEFRGDPALRLVLNQRMPQPIYIREDAVSSDFSFSGRVYPCRIPMHAIWAAYLPEGALEQGIVWDADVPEMIRTMVQAVRSLQEEQDGEERESQASEAEEQASASPEQKQEKATRGRRKGHLRVVK